MVRRRHDSLLEFSLLGPLEVRRGGEQVELGGFKQRAVLAALLLRQGEPVSSEQLLTEVWGEHPPPTAHAALQNAVSRLRKLLEPERQKGEPFRLLQTEAAGYRLVLAPGQLDLSRFERLLADGRRARGAGESRRASRLLEEAVALWRGPALAELRYEDFAQAAIARLEELRLLAVEERIEADLDAGAAAELVAELQALVLAHPLRERLHGLLMLALYRAGRQADALATYQTARRRLVDELGIDPSPSLQLLERKILSHDPDLDGGAAAPPAPERSLLVITVGATDPRLLDLATELARAQRPHELLLARAVVERGVAVPAETLASANRELEAHRRDLARVGVQARAAAFTSREPGEDLTRLANLPEIDLVLASAPAALYRDGRFDPALRELLAEAPSDVALFAAPKHGELSRPARVLVPFGGGQHDWGALEIAARLTYGGDTELQLLGATADEGSSRRDASRLLADAGLLVQRLVDVNPIPVLVEPGRKAIIDASAENDLLVVGFSDRWPEEGLGALRWALLRSARSPVLFVRRGLRPGALAPRGSATHFTWSLSRLGSARERSASDPSPLVSS